MCNVNVRDRNINSYASKHHKAKVCSFLRRFPVTCLQEQRAKKVVSDSPGLVDFAIGIVILVLNLPDGQVLFFGEIHITEGL